MNQNQRKSQHQRNPQNNYVEIINQLLETNRLLSEQIIELSKKIAELDKAPAQLPPFSQDRVMHVPETEEDAHYLLETGQIDKSEYEDMLKEIGFFNTEIVTPRGF